MILVTVTRWGDGLEVRAVGHAAFAAHGRDIVCAGVSALLFGFLSYLKTLPPSAEAGEARERMGQFAVSDSGDRSATVPPCDSPLVTYEMGEGSLWVRTRCTDGRDTHAFAVTWAGLSMIAAAYPDHLTLTEVPTDTGMQQKG